MQDIKLLLIGGTSHVGKSTLARRLADEFGWNHLSTDQLARHPGRPWKLDDRPVPEDVVEHYAQLSLAELVDSVLQHYRGNVWPIIDAIVGSRLRNRFDFGLVFEGSAMLPDMIHAAAYRGVGAVWLTAPENVISERVSRTSDYDRRSAAERHLIDAFRERTLAIDRLIRDTTAVHRQTCLDVAASDPYETLRSVSRSVL